VCGFWEEVNDMSNFFPREGSLGAGLLTAGIDLPPISVGT